MLVKYRLTAELRLQAEDAIRKKIGNRTATWINFAAFLVVGIAFGGGFVRFDPDLDRYSMQVAIALTVVATTVSEYLPKWLFRRRALQELRLHEKDETVEITDAGVDFRTAETSAHFNWSALSDVTREAAIVAIWISRYDAIPIPVSAFPTVEDETEFVAKARHHIALKKG